MEPRDRAFSRQFSSPAAAEEGHQDGRGQEEEGQDAGRIASQAVSQLSSSSVAQYRTHRSHGRIHRLASPTVAIDRHFSTGPTKSAQQHPNPSQSLGATPSK